MARCTKRPKLTLSEDDRLTLDTISRSLTEPVRKVRRAKLLLHYANGLSISQIARNVGLTREATYKWIDRALSVGALAALDDKFHRPFETKFTPEAEAWVIAIACLKPKDLGYPAEL
jgi:predicted DNA-binding protein YlxM (UPF0122 family)